jgi:uncharacterized protein (TIRG00374 family)
MSKFLKPALGFALSGFFLWLAFRNIDAAAFKDALYRINPRWVLLAFFVYLFGHVLRAFRWRLLLSTLVPVRLFSVFPVLMFGFLVNNLLPGRIGEVAKSVAASRRFSIPTASVLGTVALERLGDLVGLISILLVAIRVFPPARQAFPLVLGSLIGMGLLLLGGYLLLKKISPKFQPGSWKFRLVSLTEKLFEGVKSIRSPKVFLGLIFISITVWWIEASVLLMIGRAFGIILSAAQSAAAVSGISVGVAIPASPGFVGTYEFFGKETLRLLGYPAGLSLAFVGFLHIFQMIICSLLGLPVLFEAGSLRPLEKRPQL